MGKINTARIAELDAIGEEEVFSRITQAKSARAFCRAFFTPREEGEVPSTHAFYLWLKDGGDQRRARFDFHRKYRAHDRVEEMDEKMNGITPESAQAVRVESEWVKWRAGIDNREEFGKNATVTHEVGDSVAKAWFAAMQEVSALESPDTEEIEEAEYELLDSPIESLES